MTVIWHAEIDDKEIILSQNGRYLEFKKRNSPIIYKYDLADHTLLCYTRATGEPRTRHRGETNRWFKAKLITEDNKLAAMFTYAYALTNRRDSIKSIMMEFQNEKMKNFEKWVALGVQINIERFDHTPEALRYEPNKVQPGVRDFIISKTWTIRKLNDFIHKMPIYNDFDSKIGEIYEEVAKTPEYLSDFIIIRDGQAKNYLIEDANTIRTLLDAIVKYNLEIKRLLIYIHYLSNVECINIKDILHKYPQYLQKELEKQNGHRNRMYKFPRYLISEVYAQEERERRLKELENYDPNNQEQETLEYRDNDFFIMVPRSAEDVQDEANQQGHCVAERFMDAIAAGDTAVVFMRRTSDPHTSLITIEVRNNRMRQACIGDNDSVPERYRDWIRNWAAMKGIEIDNRSWSTMLDV